MEWHRLRLDPKGPFTDPATGKRLSCYKRPFAKTPPAVGTLLAALMQNMPGATITEIYNSLWFNIELKDILCRYIADGWGHLIAAEVFDS